MEVEVVADFAVYSEQQRLVATQKAEVVVATVLGDSC